MKNFSDVPKSDFEGFPKTIYDDGDTKLEIWKFKDSMVEYSQLILLIPNRLFSEGEVGAVKLKITGDEYVCLKPPRRMKPQIKNALQDERFETVGEDDIEPTSEFLVIRLGDELAHGIGRIFDENKIDYEKEQYIQFLKDRGAEEDKLKKSFYAANATRPTHRNIAILLTKLDTLQAFIEEVEVDEDDENAYENAVEKLHEGVDFFFEEIEHFKQEIPNSGGTEEEDDALIEIDRRVKELDQKRRQKLDEIGYENVEEED